VEAGAAPNASERDAPFAPTSQPAPERAWLGCTETNANTAPHIETADKTTLSEIQGMERTKETSESGDCDDGKRLIVI
jgi:hypothetical protein